MNDPISEGSTRADTQIGPYGGLLVIGLRYWQYYPSHLRRRGTLPLPKHLRSCSSRYGFKSKTEQLVIRLAIRLVTRLHKPNQTFIIDCNLH